MDHHLTPAELARRLAIQRRDVIATCFATGVPIVHGRIDRALFEAALRERSRRAPRESAGVT